MPWSSRPAWTRSPPPPAQLDPKLELFVQAKQLGTADAVKAARPAFEDFAGQVLVLYGDTPLLRPETLQCRPRRASTAAPILW